MLSIIEGSSLTLGVYIKKKIVLLALIFVFLVLCYFAGLLLASRIGAFILLTVGIIISLLLLLWGNRFLLSAMKVSPFDHAHKLNDVIKNLRCRLELNNVDIFSSRAFPNNIYFLESYAGNSSVVLGDNLLTNLNPQEIEALLFATMLKIKNSDTRCETLISTLLAIFDLPIAIKFLRKWKYLYEIIFMYFLPIDLLRVYLFRNKQDVLHFDQQVISLTNMPIEYASAIYRTGQRTTPSNSTLGRIVENLSVVLPDNDTLLLNVVNLGLSTRERYFALVL